MSLELLLGIKWKAPYDWWCIYRVKASLMRALYVSGLVSLHLVLSRFVVPPSGEAFYTYEGKTAPIPPTERFYFLQDKGEQLAIPANPHD